MAQGSQFFSASEWKGSCAVPCPDDVGLPEAEELCLNDPEWDDLDRCLEELEGILG
jgi:hypothetical protein